MPYVNFVLLLLLISLVLTVGWYGTLRPCEILEDNLVSRGMQAAIVRAKLAEKPEVACLVAVYKASANPRLEDPEKLF